MRKTTAVPTYQCGIAMASEAGEKGESGSAGALPIITVKFTSSDKAAGKVEISLDSSVADLKTAIRLVGTCEHRSYLTLEFYC